MKDAPQEIAKHLIADLGREDALKAASEGTVEANEAGDNYRLSIWRDVKWILKAMAVE